MAEKSHGSNDTFSEKMSQMSHLADATIVLDDGSTFKVFRLLLALESEFFNKLFAYHRDQQEFHLKEYVSKGAMEQILSWVNSHTIILSQDNILDVLKTANYLDCAGVMDQCESFLMKELCFQNVLNFWELAATSQVPDLEIKLLEFATFPHTTAFKFCRPAHLLNKLLMSKINLHISSNFLNCFALGKDASNLKWPSHPNLCAF